MIRREYNVLEAWKDRDEGNVTCHKIKKGNEESKILKYTTVLGGLSWPTNESPGYFVIFGQEWNEEYREIGRRAKKEHLKFLAEHQSDCLSLKGFFQKVTDAATLLHCEGFYTFVQEGEGRERGYYDAFNEFMSQNDKLNNLSPSISDAPFADPASFILGLELVNDWRQNGKLEILEGTIVDGQLNGITREDLKDSPEINYFAINALRFVVGAFYKFDFGPVRWRMPKKKHWMAT